MPTFNEPKKYLKWLMGTKTIPLQRKLQVLQKKKKKAAVITHNRAKKINCSLILNGIIFFKELLKNFSAVVL